MNTTAWFLAVTSLLAQSGERHGEIA
jgi:hypothetical protein